MNSTNRIKIILIVLLSMVLKHQICNCFVFKTNKKSNINTNNVVNNININNNNHQVLNSNDLINSKQNHHKQITMNRLVFSFDNAEKYKRYKYRTKEYSFDATNLNHHETLLHDINLKETYIDQQGQQDESDNSNQTNANDNPNQIVNNDILSESKRNLLDNNNNILNSNSKNKTNNDKKYLQKLLESEDYKDENFSNIPLDDEEEQEEPSNTDFEDLKKTNKHQELARGECKLAKMQISLNLKNCGRITINSTACGGLCKSGEHIIANTKLKKRTCWACKPHKFVDITYKVKCIDNSISLVTLKAISACTCFKHSETILPIVDKN